MTNSSERPTTPDIINGIQQVGIGVSDTKAVFNWYRKHLGFDILVFKDEAPAALMKRYTSGEICHRNAYLSLNMLGGGGLEIWQFLSRTPQKPKFPIILGDLGINAMKIRSNDIQKSYDSLRGLELKYLTGINKTVKNGISFYFQDPWDNLVEVVQDRYFFNKTSLSTGGVLGVVIGVSQISESIRFYSDLLGYSILVSDQTLELPLNNTPDANFGLFRKVVLAHSRPNFGGFGELLGPTQIELLQALDRKPNRIFEDRLWGDLGYIHVCFDVQGMEKLRNRAASLNYPFTVDSAQSFDMGDAAGHFGYVEDPDGTLIEFVETHKVPILKPLGIYLDLKKRNPHKPLPKWMVRTLRFHKVSKDI
ncbi:VOC family protein [Maribacter aurantiacus]|uniref:VOC family protein n=1 Tax=Maribacter aurantiacus TaxID=1882343 RepID=A0A5R8LSH5_9FLAO|nr:VOC family protein [Maribacter aurantiacus]TLF40201.1 VOC family protein [Maribacter aurantiacus]